MNDGISQNARAIFASVAQQKGLQLPQEVQTTILRQLDAAIRYDGGKPYLVDQNGNRAATADAGNVIDQPFDDFVSDLAKPFLAPAPAAPADTGKPKAGTPQQPLNLTQRMREMLAERKSKEAQLATDIRGNPWSRETLNLTHQMLIGRADPARAERLKREAKN
jgi:hypothetical protein